jgi:GMP synthase (glutamine-hydrolysing)
MKKTNLATIVIVDFGSQYSQLIVRRIRDSGVYAELWSYQSTKKPNTNIIGIILSGGPESTQQHQSPKIPKWVWDLQVPVLGICYGMQAMVKAAGGKIDNRGSGEFGQTSINLTGSFFAKLKQPKTTVWMSHQDHVATCPPDYQVTATSENQMIAAIQHQYQPWFGIQFHPEVSHSVDGIEIIKQFIFQQCKAAINWSTDNLLQQSLESIQNQVKGNDRVLLALSGGVDSSVLCTLLHQAIGERLVAVFVDHGMLRHQEAENIQSTFQRMMGDQFVLIDAKKTFLAHLEGVTDPEVKRKHIGKLFIDTFLDFTKNRPVQWLAQGTIYPDVIESAGADHAKTIKSHHNVGGLPKNLTLPLLEPFRNLFKDEVRRLGRQLKLDPKIIDRHPFPGPGLAVRIMGEVTEDRLKTLKKADHIFLTILRQANLYQQTSQAFTVYLPVQTVGVVGDCRRVGEVIAIRSVNTDDFMTATVSKIPYEILSQIATAILNQCDTIARVVFDISQKPPATIEWE